MAATSSTKASPRVYLQVVGAETKDTSPSLFIFADSQRYSSSSLIKKNCIYHNSLKLFINLKNIK